MSNMAFCLAMKSLSTFVSALGTVDDDASASLLDDDVG
eukprot:CAMPEP_0171444984 /NCGR_PEP_ID=MMETSP0881-20121228/34803_1 /TAXON_ID=67004 /ORGANISM="Thalassiosira weissflogii, Strain CCMP1336" /LENGTH=37 /DNA_ID= /DNA_START= /DNA_END= /DNA_ORIENTATION=